MLPGNTFLDTTDNPHLWIVVAGPDANGQIIFVSLTSMKGRDDRTTICGQGDHPFIERATVVAYKYAMAVDVTDLEAGVKKGSFVAREDCSAAFLKRIADGLLVSLSTPIGVANAYVDILRAELQP